MRVATSFPWRSWSAALAAVLLLLECGKLACFFAAGPAPLVYDAAVYWRLGEQISAGDLWLQRNPIGFRTPGYPWTLGLLRTLFGTRGWMATIALQHAAVGVTTLLTACWVWQWTGRMALVNLALVVRLVSFSSTGYASTVLTETLFEPVFLGLMVMLRESGAMEGSSRLFGIGVLFAIGFLFRPAISAIIPVVMVAAWLTPSPPDPPQWRMAVGKLAIAGGVSVAMIGPWCMRNAIVCGQASPVIFLGRELWVSVYSPGSPAGPSLPETSEARAILEQGGARLLGEAWRHNWTVSSALTDAGATDAEADRAMRTVAMQGLCRDPLRWILRCVWRTVDLWRSVFSREQALYGGTSLPTMVGTDQQLWGSENWRAIRDRVLDASLETRLLAVELGSLLGLLGTLGLCLHPRTSRWGLLLVLTFMCTAGMTGVLEIPNHRYRLILEPLLIVGSLAGGQVWFDLIRRGRQELLRQRESHVATGENRGEISTT